MTQLLGLVVIAAAVVAVVRKVDVRLALVLGGLALGALAHQPGRVVRTFFVMFTREQFVVPICTAMGFAYVLRQTGCDRHMVVLLVRPIRRVRPLLVPGTVLVGFLVNIPVVSQTGTLVAIGSVLVPLLQAARVSRATAGAALLLGCSIGGELLNPAAPELRTVGSLVRVEATEFVRRVVPLILPHLALACALFWAWTLRAERRFLQAGGAADDAFKDPTGGVADFRVNPLKAAVPLLPITLLFLTGPPLPLFAVPRGWLIQPDNPADAPLFASRQVGAAMLVGVVAAGLVGGRAALGTARAFFEGAGYAFGNIISVIVAATCFGAGVAAIGLADRLGEAIAAWPGLLFPSAGGLPLAFAWVSGSGMASTQSLFGFFVEPARAVGVDPVRVGAVVSIAAAAGRTVSPVAAVTLLCAALTETNPLELIRPLALPLLAGVTLVVIEAVLLAG